MTDSFAGYPWSLSLGILLWVAGFDCIYACLDADFDRQAGLVHDEAHGCLWQRAFGLCSGFGEVTTDGSEAASVLRGKLCGTLLALAVALPKSENADLRKNVELYKFYDNFLLVLFKKLA